MHTNIIPVSLTILLAVVAWGPHASAQEDKPKTDWVEVPVADDVAAQSDRVGRLELRLQLSADADPEQVAVKFNGIKLQNPAKEDAWWIFALVPRQASSGRNLLTPDGGRSVERGKPVTLEKVEVHVRYRPNQRAMSTNPRSSSARKGERK